MSLGKELAGKFDLAGQVAVITGAGSGLGQESARVLSLAGAKVILTDINKQGLDETAAILTSTGGEVEICSGDVSVQGDMEAVADRAIAKFGRLDIWVNSAGLPLVEPILSTQREAAYKVIDVNMMGTYWGCAAAARVMKDYGRGAIVNISSGGGDSPVPNLSIYGMTKAAVNQLTRVAAHEFGIYGIRVNAIAPGWIETPMGADLYKDADGNMDPVLRERIRSEQAQSTPLGINGTSMDIALALLYLASDASGFINGQVLRVNGGQTM